MPVLLAFDKAASEQAAAAATSHLGRCLSMPLPKPEEHWPILLHLDFGGNTLQWTRAWLMIRASGRWPLCLYGQLELPAVLPECPGCGKDAVTVAHALCECGATQAFHRPWGLDDVEHIFQFPSSWSALERRIQHVGRCLATILSRRAAAQPALAAGSDSE